MHDFFAWFGRKKPSTPVTRLSRDEALAIARRAAENAPLAAELALTSVQQVSGRTVWIVSSATRGLMLEITIDDADGTVLEQRHVGLR